jgi:hypothetical protein
MLRCRHGTQQNVNHYDIDIVTVHGKKWRISRKKLLFTSWILLFAVINPSTGTFEVSTHGGDKNVAISNLGAKGRVLSVVE